MLLEEQKLHTLVNSCILLIIRTINQSCLTGLVVSLICFWQHMVSAPCIGHAPKVHARCTAARVYMALARARPHMGYEVTHAQRPMRLNPNSGKHLYRRKRFPEYAQATGCIKGLQAPGNQAFGHPVFIRACCKSHQLFTTRSGSPRPLDRFPSHLGITGVREDSETCAITIAHHGLPRIQCERCHLFHVSWFRFCCDALRGRKILFG